MNKSKDIPIDYIKECLIYDKDTGEFFWKERPQSHFKSKCAFVRFNKNYPNKRAGCLEKTASGYRYWAVTIDNIRYKLHRIAWLFENKEITGYIDHINGDSTDNRIKNLRVVNPSQNGFNTGKDSTYSWYGIRPKDNKWEVWFPVNGKQIYFGRFDTELEAAEYRKELEIKYGVLRRGNE